MRFKLHLSVFLLCLLFIPGLQKLAQGDPSTTAKMFTRYKNGAGYNRLLEDALTLVLSVESGDREKIAVRVCSRQPMPFALAIAGADPFRIAEFFVGRHGYTPEQVTYLRSEDCLASEDPLGSVTEVWTVPQGGSLPPHVEAYAYNKIRLSPLGQVEANRGVRDYKRALRKLITSLRANPSSVGVVFGYYLERPSPALRHRLHAVTRTLEQSGLPAQRYLVRPKSWDDEVSTYPPDSEPTYPSLFVVEVKKMGDNARK